MKEFEIKIRLPWKDDFNKMLIDLNIYIFEVFYIIKNDFKCKKKHLYLLIALSVFIFIFFSFWDSLIIIFSLAFVVFSWNGLALLCLSLVFIFLSIIFSVFDLSEVSKVFSSYIYFLLFGYVVLETIKFLPDNDLEMTLKSNQVEALSDFREYVADIEKLTLVNNRHNFNYYFSSIIGWLADAIRVTGKAVDNIYKPVIKRAVEEIQYVKPKIIMPKLTISTPDFVSPNFFRKVGNISMMILRVIFTWQILANLIIAGICLWFSYGALMAGDTTQMIIKLGFSLFLVFAVNGMILLNRK